MCVCVCVCVSNALMCLLLAKQLATNSQYKNLCSVYLLSNILRKSLSVQSRAETAFVFHPIGLKFDTRVHQGAIRVIGGSNAILLLAN